MNATIHTEHDFPFDMLLKYAFREMTAEEKQSFEEFLDDHIEYAEMLESLLDTCISEQISTREEYENFMGQQQQSFREKAAAELGMTEEEFLNYQPSKKNTIPISENKTPILSFRLHIRKYGIAASVVLLAGLSASLYQLKLQSERLSASNEASNKLIDENKSLKQQIETLNDSNFSLKKSNETLEKENDDLVQKLSRKNPVMAVKWLPNAPALKKLKEKEAPPVASGNNSYPAWKAALGRGEFQLSYNILDTLLNNKTEVELKENYPTPCYVHAALGLGLKTGNLSQIIKYLRLNLETSDRRDNTAALLAEAYAYKGQREKGLNMIKAEQVDMKALQGEVRKYYESK